MPEEQAMREARSSVVQGQHLDGASVFCSGPTHGSVFNLRNQSCHQWEST